MRNPIKEEVQRFNKLFTTYGRVILSGIVLSAIFLFLYTGVRANYVSVEILTVVLSTLTLGVAALALYMNVRLTRHRRLLRESENIAKRGAILTGPEREWRDEQVRLVSARVNELTNEELRSIARMTRRVAATEHLLLGAFRFGFMVAYLFYYGLKLVRIDFGSSKDPKEV